MTVSAILVFVGLALLGVGILAVAMSGANTWTDGESETLREEGRKYRLHAYAASLHGPCNPIAKGADCDDCPGFCIETVGETRDENYVKRQQRARDWLNDHGLTL